MWRSRSIDTTGGRLDALVVSNRHWDHVSGFLEAQAVFDRIEVGEVWLAWTEDPADDLARALAGRREAAAGALEHVARMLAASPDCSVTRLSDRLKGLLGFDGQPGAAGVRTSDQAMRWVKGRPGTRLRYLQPAGGPITVPGTDGVRVYVLGPPRDPEALLCGDPSVRPGPMNELAGVDGAGQGVPGRRAGHGGRRGPGLRRRTSLRGVVPGHGMGRGLGRGVLRHALRVRGPRRTGLAAHRDRLARERRTAGACRPTRTRTTRAWPSPSS